MPSQRDYYEILGVPRSANPEQLKGAFRNLARKYHPDVSKEPDAEARFKEINEAYAVLSDPEKRARYDQFGHAGLEGMGGVPDYTTVDFTDILEGLFGFGGFSSRQRRNSPHRGTDLSQSVQLTFEEVVTGVDKEIEITRDEECATCKGTGAEPGTSRIRCQNCGGRGEVRQVRQTFLGSMVQVTTCPNCNGSGEVLEHLCYTCRGRGLELKKSHKMVHIPAGVDNGTQIRLAGEGQPGVNGGPHGNLYLEIRVKPHKFFSRKEDDVLLNLSINLAQAVLGAEVEIPTVEKPAKLNIPAGTQPGKVFMLKNKGIPHVRGSGRGNQLVIIDIDIPSHLTGEQKKLFEQLAKTMGSEVHPQEHSFFDALKDIFGGQ
jgi:molecular chaperone DnaJ